MNVEEILQQSSWKGQIPTESSVVFEMPDDIAREFEDFYQKSGNQYEAIINDITNGQKLPLLSAWVKELSPYVRQSPGFICIRTSEDRFTSEQLRVLYVCAANELGSMNDRYGYLFDVMDRGLDYTKEAIPVSKTCATTGYHTDSTAREYTPDIVGLLCVYQAREGGENLLGNAADIYKYLAANNPEAVEALSKPIIRDVITPGVVQNNEAILKNSFPVFEFDEHGLRFRYMRYWIETAHEKTGVPMPEGLVDAMNAVDNYLAEEQNVFKYRLQRGDMLFMNNAFLGHNRTDFYDYDDPEVKRRMTRTWINWRAS